MNISSSQSTANTKNQFEKDENIYMHKSSCGRIDVAEKIGHKMQDAIMAHPKILTSIERELMRKESDEIKKPLAKVVNSTDKVLLASR